MVVMVIPMFVCSGGVWIRMSGGLGQVVQVRVSLGETVLWELARYVARACVRLRIGVVDGGERGTTCGYHWYLRC